MHAEKVIFLDPAFRNAAELTSLLACYPEIRVVPFEARAFVMRKTEISWWLSTHTCDSFVIVDTDRRYGVYDSRVAIIPKWGWTATVKAEVVRLFDVDRKLPKWG